MSATHPPGVWALTGVRDAFADALTGTDETDPPVLVDVVDSLNPPCLMLVWGDPWLAPGIEPGIKTMGPVLWTARLQVLCVGSRLEPGPGIRQLEELVTHTVVRMAADIYPWPLDGVTGPRVFDLAGVSYLGARVTYLVPITV